jgi:hypothetical protein
MKPALFCKKAQGAQAWSVFSNLNYMIGPNLEKLTYTSTFSHNKKVYSPLPLSI